jgi:hypothetical protein
MDLCSPQSPDGSHTDITFVWESQSINGSVRTAIGPIRGAARPLRTCVVGVALAAGVDMIDIASGCAKRTYKSDFWRNRCVNHSYFLICTQGKS